MAVSADLQKVDFKIYLNTGTTEKGKVKTVTVSLPALNVDRYDDQRASNIAKLYSSISQYPVYEKRKIETSLVSEV